MQTDEQLLSNHLDISKLTDDELHQAYERISIRIIDGGMSQKEAVRITAAEIKAVKGG